MSTGQERVERPIPSDTLGRRIGNISGGHAK